MDNIIYNVKWCHSYRHFSKKFAVFDVIRFRFLAYITKLNKSNAKQAELKLYLSGAQSCTPPSTLALQLKGRDHICPQLKYITIF